MEVAYFVLVQALDLKDVEEVERGVGYVDEDFVS